MAVFGDPLLVLGIGHKISFARNLGGGIILEELGGWLHSGTYVVGKASTLQIP